MKLKVIFLAAAAALLFSTVATADRTAGETVDDSTTQAAVKAELMGDDFFGGMGINIETHKGVVQLGGWIDDAEAGANAAKLAAVAIRPMTFSTLIFIYSPIRFSRYLTI